MTTLEIVKGRLDEGRTIADADVRRLVDMVDRYRVALENLKGWIHITANRRFDHWEDGLVEMDKLIDEALSAGANNDA